MPDKLAQPATPGFFDFSAEVGLTKHIGGVAATRELIELCHIDASKYVLDVGCGAGQTPLFLAQTTGCPVMGVDILPAMVARAQDTARRAGVLQTGVPQTRAGGVEFRVADAQALPFDDAVFDAVLTESVTSFTTDRQKAVREYARVVRPGGYVGLNESVWLKTPVPQEIVAWASQDLGSQDLGAQDLGSQDLGAQDLSGQDLATPEGVAQDLGASDKGFAGSGVQMQVMTAGECLGYLQGTGLQEITSRVYAIDPAQEAKGLAERYGKGGILRIFGRMLRLYLRSPAYRAFVKSTRQGGVLPANLSEYFGYGIFVGRKVLAP